jgi:hypothetical protein
MVGYFSRLERPCGLVEELFRQRQKDLTVDLLDFAYTHVLQV